MTVLMCAVVFAPNLAQAKRTPAPKVEPVVYEGVKYVAPNDNGRRAYVQAWDTKTGALLWEVTVFRTPINPALEEDVQWIFIKELRMAAGNLMVLTERQGTYTVDLKTRAVKKQEPAPSAKPPPKPEK